MTLTIQLHETEAARLRERAHQLGVRPEDLATVAVRELLQQPTDEFESAADHVLRKNEELYRRLA